MLCLESFAWRNNGHLKYSDGVIKYYAYPRAGRRPIKDKVQIDASRVIAFMMTYCVFKPCMIS